MVVGLLLVMAGLVIGCYSLCNGPINFSLVEMAHTLLGNGDPLHHIAFWNIRVPRVLSAIISGAALSVAGCVMQCLLRNPLASPFTMGISQGAAFGAAFAIIGFSAEQGFVTQGLNLIANPYFVTLFAFLGAFVGTLFILTLSSIRQLNAHAMVLAGVAIGSLFSAATMLLQYFADNIKVASVVFWTFGDLSRTNMNDVWILFCVTVPAMVYFFLKRHDYNAMQIDNETARSVGVNTERSRYCGVLIAALLTSTVVAFLGIIGFVGLLGPHVARRLVDSDHRYVIGVSALVGGVLLLAADTAARMIMAPTVLPVGILTSFLGAPLFLYLIAKRSR